MEIFINERRFGMSFITVNKFDLHGVQEWLDSNMSSVQPVLTSSRDSLEPISTNEAVQEMLRSVLSDDSALAEIALRSYTHINGFDKFVLIVSKNYKLRLHIWWPEHAVKHMEHVHDHPWDFSSRILLGSLRFQTISINDYGAMQLNHYKISANENLEHSLDYLGEVNADWDLDAVLSKDSYYTLSRKIKHRVIKDNTVMTATLMLQGPAGDGQSNMFTEEIYTSGEKVEIPSFSIHEVKDKLGRFLKELTQHT
jgi:hypothetical protein